MLTTIPGHPNVTFSNGILVLPGNPRFGFNGSSHGGPGGTDDANSGATYAPPDETGQTVSIFFDISIFDLAFDVADIDVTSTIPEFINARVFDSEIGGSLLGSLTVSGGDPGTGDGLLTPISFSGITGIRRLEFGLVNRIGGRYLALEVCRAHDIARFHRRRRS